MDWFSPTSIGLILLAFAAAVLNGAVGYGFSSLITPVAVFWFSNRVLNPALVLVELGVNVTLLVRERSLIAATFPRAKWTIVGLAPGVILGSIALSVVAPTFVKLSVYGVLLPLVVLQLFGLRRRIGHERATGPILGGAIGFLYSLTTISGPPLALYWRNQGLAKREFRCTMAQIRVAEASMTVVTYYFFGFFTGPALSLVPLLIVPVILGVPLGTLLLMKVSREFFSRVVMTMDGIIVSYGLSKILSQVGWLSYAESLVLLALLLVAILLLGYTSIRKLGPAATAAEDPETAPVVVVPPAN